MKLAIFDFDGTLFLKDTLPALGEEWVKQGRSKSRYQLIYLWIIPVVILYKTGMVSRERMKYFAMKRFQRIFRGMNQEEIKTFFKDAYPGIRSYFNPAVAEEIKQAQTEGYHLVLLSGAYSDLLELVAGDLGIDTVIGAELHYRDNGLDFTREISFIDGISKLKLLEQRFAHQDVDWAACKSYGDSYSDKFVLEIAGEPVAVNPDKKLLEHAQCQHWRVM